MLIDLVFLLLTIFACIKGSRKGFIIALFSVVAFIIGLAAALKLSAVVAIRLSENMNVSGKWLPIIAFLLVFIAVAFLVNLGGKFLQKTIEIAMLGWVNRIAGMVLYILVYTIIYSIFLFYGVQLHIIKEQAIATSKMYPFIQPIGPKVINMLGAIIPIFKDIFTQLEQFFGLVSNKIAH